MSEFKKRGLPQQDELVLCTVKKIHPNSAFVTLDEYENIEGMLHISEVALKGVKKIKDYLNVGKKIVCKVMRVKGREVDVSLKRVSSGARKKKLNDHRTEKRFYHIVEYSCNEAGASSAAKKIMEEFINKFGSIANAYEELRNKGLTILNGISIPEKVKPLLKANFESMLKQLRVRIKRSVSVSSTSSDGVERIRKVLASYKAPKDADIKLIYEGSGRFKITVEAKNYKEAEKLFDELREKFLAKGKELNVLVNFNE